MYCPKCKENFEEGSRRFCPTDGARLISDSTAAAGNQLEGGIFANLIPKKESGPDLDESLSDIPRFVITEPKAEKIMETPSDIGGDFFVLEPIDTEPIREPIFQKPVDIQPVVNKPAARKVDPKEIPAGHVELGQGNRLAASSADFREDNPEAFVGRTVKGRYFVTELFGGEEGSYAFLADDKIVPDKKVLVRILLDYETDEMLGSILDEERVSLSHFSHPNIARLIDSGQFTDGTRFLITEFVDALTVRDILSIHGMFGRMRAARIIRQAANALNEAHQEGVLHRDLRPSNIIVSPTDNDSENVTLVNFGASNGEPNKQNVMYKAPEVLDGRISTVASDIYSLAVLSYEMLTGQLPFKGNKQRELMRSQYAGLDQRATGLNPDLPPSIDDVFDKALSFSVAGRYVKAREFGDAVFAALTDAALPPPALAAPIAELPKAEEPVLDLPVVPAEAEVRHESTPVPAKPDTTAEEESTDEPAWTRRSPEPPETGSSRMKIFLGGGILILLALLAFGWYYLVNHPVEPEIPANVSGGTNTNGVTQPSTIISDTEMPPLPRNLPQPPNTNFYQNSKQNLRGDLLRNFVAFTLYYPKDWKVNGPQESSSSDARGKFLDISRVGPEGRLREQMLISYYASKGTFREDSAKFPELVKETNDTLKKILPEYQMVSEGEITLNGDWKAYEVKFQGGGTSAAGEKLVVWGRRLFIPAARPGVRDGFEITMLATSESAEVRSVDDVGVKGELAGILYSFEPSQNF